MYKKKKIQNTKYKNQGKIYIFKTHENRSYKTPDKNILKKPKKKKRGNEKDRFFSK
jgi:hypothetical protein